MKRWILLLCALSLVSVGPAGAITIDITTTDPAATYTNGTLTIAAGPNAVVLPGSGSLSGADFVITLTRNGAEGPATVGTEFIGSAGAEVMMVMGIEVLLTADIDSILVTNLVPGPPGSTFTSVNLGSLDGLNAASITITGGTKANEFGGIGTEGTIFALWNKPTKIFLPGQVFNSNFSGQMNVQMRFEVPEPGTLGLLALGTVGFLARMRPRR